MLRVLKKSGNKHDADYNDRMATIAEAQALEWAETYLDEDTIEMCFGDQIEDA